jgi:N-acetylglutamate synthase-like GNAT family acetyltransferase
MPARISTARAPVTAPPLADPETVRRATARDLAYVVHLQKRHGDAIGFLPRAALAQKIDLSRVWLARENGQAAGFLHHGSLAQPEVRIFQAALLSAARRRHLGLALVADLVARARDAGARGVSLRCLSYLEANDVWTAAGFRLLTTEPGAKGTLNVWGKEIANFRLPTADCADGPFDFASRIHPCPRCGTPTTDTWTRGARRRRRCARCVQMELSE